MANNTHPTSSALDALMDTVVGLESTVAAKVAKSNYETLVAHGNLSSYSMDQIFHDCPRKWELTKLQAAMGASQRFSSPTFAFGHAVGAGVATFDATRDVGKAIFQAFLAWDIDLLEEGKTKGDKPNGKSFWEAVVAIQKYETFYYGETDLDDYEVTNIEAVLGVDFENGFFYTGHIDELLMHRVTKEFRVKENKTTGFEFVDPALYAHSDQALSYAIVLDNFGAANYAVLYTIYSSASKQWIQFEFPKSVLSKAEWVQDQLLMQEQRLQYTAINFFPKRGGSCLKFGSRCQFYETCGMDSKRTYGVKLSELPRVSSLTALGEIEPTDFPTTVSKILATQKEKLQ